MGHSLATHVRSATLPTLAADVAPACAPRGFDHTCEIDEEQDFSRCLTVFVCFLHVVLYAAPAFGPKRSDGHGPARFEVRIGGNCGRTRSKTGSECRAYALRH